MISLLMNYWAY